MILNGLAVLHGMTTTEYLKPLPTEIITKILKYVDTNTLKSAQMMNTNWHYSASQLIYYNPQLMTVNQVKKLKRVIDLSLDGFTTLAYHSMIRGIDLSGLEDSGRSSKVVGEWIIQIIKMTRNMNLDSKMDLMIIERAKTVTVGQIRYLDLGFCKAVKNDEICAAKRYLTKIINLNLSGGGRNDRVMNSLASYCLNLERLSLAWNIHLSDLTLFSLSQNCKMLKSLDLSHCVDMSDDGLKAIAMTCPLEYLSVNWCARITLESLRLIIQIPSLKLLNFIGTDCNYKDLKLLNENKDLIFNDLDALPFYK
eukprot:NODE_1082_length_2296_cov_0.491124.p1 type:complete len:309 gc:universal NODE_1082_length_2296_cov_0.491124:980-54(-)